MQLELGCVKIWLPASGIKRNLGFWAKGERQRKGIFIKSVGELGS
jgi:hypothetical protein